MEIERLSKFKNDDFKKLANEIYNVSKNIIKDYPNYKEWYWNVNIPRVINNSGDIFFIRENNKIIALSSLKKTDEYKICTIYIEKHYRNKHIGMKLMEEITKYFGINNPLITFYEDKYPLFLPFIKKYNWKLTRKVIRGNKVELYFNEANKKIQN